MRKGCWHYWRIKLPNIPLGFSRHKHNDKNNMGHLSEYLAQIGFPSCKLFAVFFILTRIIQLADKTFIHSNIHCKGWNKSKAIGNSLHERPLPIIVMDGLKRPFGKKRSWSSSLANGLFGFGSNGVPSIRVHGPMIVFQPRMLYKIQQCSYAQTNSTCRTWKRPSNWPNNKNSRHINKVTVRSG